MVNLIGIYTHYFFLLALLVQAIYFFLVWPCRLRPAGVNESKPQILAGLTAVATFLLLSFLPWLYGLYSTYGSGSLAPVFGQPTSFNMVLSLFEFLFGAQSDALAGATIALWPLIALGAFLFLTRRPEKFTPEIGLLLLGIFLPIVIAFGVSITVRPLYLTRYLTVAAPFLYILIAWFISRLPVGRKPLTIGLLTILLIGLYIQETSPNSPAREEYWDATSFLENIATPRDIIVLAPPYLIYPFQYYYDGPAKITSLPIWDKKKGAIPLVTEERLAADAVTIKASHKRILLLVSDDLAGAVEAKNYFDKHLTKLGKRQFSRHLWVHIYQAEYSDKTINEISPAAEINTEPPLADSQNGQIYTVKPGDTLFLVAEQLYDDGFRYLDLAAQNNIANPDIIMPGQVIHINP